MGSVAVDLCQEAVHYLVHALVVVYEVQPDLLVEVRGVVTAGHGDALGDAVPRYIDVGGVHKSEEQDGCACVIQYLDLHLRLCLDTCEDIADRVLVQCLPVDQCAVIRVKHLVRRVADDK